MHIGIVGCGQLARMLALAGLPMGHSFSFLAYPGESDECIRGLGTWIIGGAEDDPARLYEDLGRPAVITVEKEAVDTALLKALSAFCPVHPDPGAVAICQHRAREKTHLTSQGVGVAPFEIVQGPQQLLPAAGRLGYPVIIKSCEQGYDGQNQWAINRPEDLDPFINGDVRLPAAVMEKRISFNREISLLIVRGTAGEIVSYPVTENHHQDGILLSSVAPADGLTERLMENINAVAARVMSGWNYVGVLAVECFQQDEHILVNELAPRVHNSGHWTMGGSATSQFENHLRAITGSSLGSTRALGQTGMINLLGCPVPDSVRAMPDAHVHWYNKGIKPRRKVGHVTLVCEDRPALLKAMTRTLEAAYPLSEAKKLAHG